MKKNLFLRLCLMMAVVLSVYSCRQELDLTTEQQREEAFFKTNLSKLNPVQEKVLSYLKQKNDKNNFVSSLKDKFGLPVWETTKLIKNLDSKNEISPLGKTAILSNGNILYSVPLVEDGFITSILYTEIKDEEVIRVQEITNEDLWLLINDDKYDKSFREFILLNCLSYDKELFGNNLFGNIPTGLLGLTEESNHRIRIGDSEPSETSKVMLNFNCVMYYSNCQGCIGSCDGCGGYGGTICILTRNCTATWTDDGTWPTTGGSDTPGSGGGSTTSTPTQTPPKDPCSLDIVSKAFYRLKPNCGDGGGLPILDDPCEKIKKSTNDLKYKADISNLEGKTGLNHEEGYRLGNPISGTNQSGTQNQLLQNLPSTTEVDMKIFNNTFALMHTHYDGIYPVFSPGDILLFNQWIVWANSWNAVPTNTPKIPLNNLTLTLVTSNGNYLFTFDGTQVDALPTYTQQQFDDLNDKYKTKYLDNAITNGNINMERLEKEFLKFINEKMNMTGLKLYRVKSDGNYEISLSDLEGTKCP